MLRNVVKCCENRFHNIPKNFTTFHNILENLTGAGLQGLEKHKLRPSNDKTYGLLWKSLYRFSSERPLNVVKSRTGKNHSFLGGPRGDFTTFSGFHNISQHSDNFHNIRAGKG